MKSRGKRYDADIRARAVRLVVENGRSVSEVSQDLGVPIGTISRWVKKHEENQDTDKVRIKELEAEIKALKKPQADLEDTVEILKKAATILSKH